MSGVVVTFQHARRAAMPGRRGQLCAPGIYAWARRHGIDVGAFCRHGQPVEVFDRIGDAFAQRVARIARADTEARHGQ